MPLSPAGRREPLVERNIRCQGFRREDGLWEVEACLIDTRSFERETPFRPMVPAGAPFHEMWVRIAMDDDRTLHAVEVSIDGHPFPECPSVMPNFARLVGLRIGPGFSRELQARVGGEEGCTHVLTLFTNMATVAVQTVASQLRWDDRAAAKRIYGLDQRGKPPVVGSCRGYGRGGEMVRQVYPQYALRSVDESSGDI